MTTFLRIRRDGIPLHNHPTNRNPSGHWHGAWEQHHDMRDAHIVHDAVNPIFETAGRDRSHMSIENAIRWGNLSIMQWEMYRRSLEGEILIHWYARKQERKAARNGTAPVATNVSVALGPDDWMLPLTARRFGVEMECGVSNLSLLITACLNRGLRLDDQMDTYSHATPETWKAMGDGSLRWTGGMRGIEIVSPILQGAEGLRQLKLMCEALNEVGAKVNSTCGLHVHHDANDMTTGTARRVAMNYQNGQAAIDKLVAPSRRGTQQYCGPFDSHEIRMITTAENIADFPRNRYKNINIAPAHVLHKTFEIRQHQGTVEFLKVAAWVKLGQAMMEQGKAGVMVETGTADLALFFNKMSLPMHLRQFFRSRTLKLKTITETEGERILNDAGVAPIFMAEEEAPADLTSPMDSIPSVFTRDRYGRIVPTVAGLA